MNYNYVPRGNQCSSDNLTRAQPRRISPIYYILHDDSETGFCGLSFSFEQWEFE